MVERLTTTVPVLETVESIQQVNKQLDTIMFHLQKGLPFPRRTIHQYKYISVKEIERTNRRQKKESNYGIRFSVYIYKLYLSI